MKKHLSVTLIILSSFWGCWNRGPIEAEERTVFLAHPDFLKPYKEQCIQQHGTFCAKEISDDEKVAVNAYSNMMTTTEYLLICKKPKQTPASKPECVPIP